MQMELNIYIFPKDKLKQEVELIHVLSNRSNLKLSRLQIFYRTNDILLLFSRSVLKRGQSPWTNQMHPFICLLSILQKDSGKSWSKANAMGVNKLNSLMKTIMAEKDSLRWHFSPYEPQCSTENDWFTHWMIRILFLVIYCSCEDTKMCRVWTTTVVFQINNRKIRQEN